MDQHSHQDRSGWAAGEEDAPSRLRLPKTAELIAEHLRDQIANGALIAGEHLPAEAILTDAFGISRATLREALRILESERLLCVTRGARTGAQVLQPSLEPMARHTAMLLRANQITAADLFAARLSIEPDAVKCLCEAPDAAAMVILQDQLDRVHATLATGALDVAIAQLNGFHVLLAEGAGNRTVALFAAILRRLIAAQQRVIGAHRLPAADQRRQHLVAALNKCRTLLTLIETGDAAAAVAHWRAYLTAANAVWLAGGEGARVVELPPPR